MATTVSLQTLAEYMEKFGWKYYNVQDDGEDKGGKIRTGWRSAPSPRGFDMTIDLMVPRKCLSFRVRRVAMAPWQGTPPDRLVGLLSLLGWANYSTILGKFSYDVRDGEVRLSVDIPIDESSFNYEQFEHVMRILLTASEEWEPRIHELLRGDKPVGQIIIDDARDSGSGPDFLNELEDAFKWPKNPPPPPPPREGDLLTEV